MALSLEVLPLNKLGKDIPLQVVEGGRGSGTPHLNSSFNCLRRLAERMQVMRPDMPAPIISHSLAFRLALANRRHIKPFSTENEFSALAVMHELVDEYRQLITQGNISVIMPPHSRGQILGIQFDNDPRSQEARKYLSRSVQP